ncbi:hypothetical protein D9M69_614470 [compost metagenome]
MQLDGKGVDQQVADQEHRHRKRQDREQHDQAVDPGAGPIGGQHAQRHRHQDRHQHRERGNRQRGLDALRQQLRHRHLGEDGRAEVALQQLAGPQPELPPQWIVQAQRLAQLGDVVRGSEIPGDQRRRVSGRQVDQQEDDHRHHRHDRHDGEHPPNDVTHSCLAYR